MKGELGFLGLNYKKDERLFQHFSPSIRFHFSVKKNKSITGGGKRDASMQRPVNESGASWHWGQMVVGKMGRMWDLLVRFGIYIPVRGAKPTIRKSGKEIFTVIYPYYVVAKWWGVSQFQTFESKEAPVVDGSLVSTILK